MQKRAEDFAVWENSLYPVKGLLPQWLNFKLYLLGFPTKHDFKKSLNFSLQGNRLSKKDLEDTAT